MSPPPGSATTVLRFSGVNSVAGKYSIFWLQFVTGGAFQILV